MSAMTLTIRSGFGRGFASGVGSGVAAGAVWVCLGILRPDCPIAAAAAKPMIAAVTNRLLAVGKRTARFFITPKPLIIHRSDALALLQFDPVPVRRFDTQEMMNEEVEAFSFAILAARPVSRSGQYDQIEDLICLDQGVHHLH